jgi:ankyrin repeat protein
VVDEHGSCPLTIECFHRDLETVKYLLAKGADPDIYMPDNTNEDIRHLIQPLKTKLKADLAIIEQMSSVAPHDWTDIQKSVLFKRTAPNGGVDSLSRKSEFRQKSLINFLEDKPELLKASIAMHGDHLLGMDKNNRVKDNITAVVSTHKLHFIYDIINNNPSIVQGNDTNNIFPADLLTTISSSEQNIGKTLRAMQCTFPKFDATSEIGNMVRTKIQKNAPIRFSLSRDALFKRQATIGLMPPPAKRLRIGF